MIQDLCTTKICYLLYFYLQDRAAIEMVNFDLMPMDFEEMLIPLEAWEPVNVYGIDITIDEDGLMQMDDSQEPSENFLEDWLETFGDTLLDRIATYKSKMN